MPVLLSAGKDDGRDGKVNMCPWCTDPDAEDWDEDLCRMHEAEYEGTSVAELDRRDSEQYSEYIDCYGR